MGKPRYSEDQIQQLTGAIDDAAKRCRKNGKRGRLVTTWSTIIDPTSGWPVATRGFQRERARILFQEPPGAYDRKVVLLIESARIGIPTFGPDGKDNEYAPFGARDLCKYFTLMTHSARRYLTAGAVEEPHDILQFHIDALAAMQ